MPSPKSNFRFTTTLASVKGDPNFISTIYTVVFIPDEVVKKLPQGRNRMKGTINGAPFALAVQNLRDGRRYFTVSSSLRRAAKIRGGDKVDVQFRLVDPDRVEMPEELEAVLEQDDAGMQAWKSLTPGLQRSLIHYITSVKNVDSRINRAMFLIEKAKTGAYSRKKKNDG